MNQHKGVLCSEELIYGFSCEQLLSKFVYTDDIRLEPNNYRRGQFKVGWEAATLRGKVYTDALRKLTWCNLGYRLGEQFSKKPEDEIYKIYDCFASQYEPNKKLNESLNNFKYKNNDIDQIVISLLPEGSKREICLQIFVALLNRANSHGSHKWGVYHQRGQIRLLVGDFIVLSIEKGCVWLALDKQFLQESQELQHLIEKSGDWSWDENDYPKYNSIPSKNGYYIPSGKHLEIWSLISRLHFDFIDKIAQKYKKLKKDSQRKHKPELLNYLRDRLGQFIPEPSYEESSELNEFVLPEEILDDENLYEGSKQRVTVNAYERNLQARKTCIAHYGTKCQICGFDFAEKYGIVGRGFTHVHHLKPLSDIGKKYKVDPVRDLRPVCPNCHSIIHRRNPPYTIEEVQEFLQHI